jgi:uncharacterized membrane protein
MNAPVTEYPLGHERPTVARRDLIVLLVAAACLQALAWAVLLALFSGGWMGYGLHQLADTLLYHFYASSFALGRWPYADIPVEYPPLANLVFLLPPSGGAVAEYERWFSTTMIAATTAAAVLTTAAAALAWRSVPRGLVVAAGYAVLTLCCGALALNRYDAVVALIVATALFFLAVRRSLPASISLGLGFALKLTPALLLPLVLLLQERRRGVLVALAGFAVAAALPFVPFVINDPGTAATPFTYHERRPLQLESIPGTPWAAATLLGAARPRIVSAYGSQNFSGSAPDFVAAASPWALAICVGAVYVLVWRRRSVLRDAPALVPVAALAVLLVAICASKVLSPQFLIWTFPVVALCVAQPRWLPRLAAVGVGVATALTQIEFPARYWELVALHDGPLLILLLRNLTLVAATALAIAAVVRLSPVPPSAPTSRS